VISLRGLVAVLVAAIVAPVLLIAALRVSGPEIVRSVENGGDWYARSPGWFTSRGLYPTEHAPDGSPFAWAGGRLRLQIPQLDRRVPRELRLRVRSGRASSDVPAVLRVMVDGVDAVPATVGSDWQEITVPLPAARARGATVAIDAQQTFTPGPQDARVLGFMLDRLTLTAPGGAALTPSIDVLAAVALFAASVALAAVLCGLAPWIAAAGGVAAGAAACALLLFDAAVLGSYGERLMPLAIAVACCGMAARLLSSLASPDTMQGWRTAALIAIVVTTIKLAVFLHPGAPIGDGMFHVHRAQAVRAGNYIFTSVTPRPFYEFPYPVGLYVAAQPFWTVTADRVALLRGLTLVLDAFVALALFGVVSSRWGSTPGVLAAALASSFPVVVQGISTANLTNVFAQSWFSLAVAWIGWHLSSRRAIVAGLGTVALLGAAYLSHFSTAVIGVPAAVLIVAAIAFARDPGDARAWRWAAIAVLLAIGLSYVLYYSHFHDVYARTWSRIGQEGADTSFVATLEQHSESKAVTLARFLLANYGWGGLALMAAGFVVMLKRGWRDGWTLVLLAFGLVVDGFLLLGAFTPVEMRANLAAHPLVAVLAALGCASLWQSGRPPLRLIAAAGLAATVWAGARAVLAVLGSA
jgi:hypothetical protein